MDILLKNCQVLAPDGLLTGCIWVSGKQIKQMSQSIPSDFKGRVIDGKNKLVMPGMVNAHTHIPMTALRGYSDDLKLHDWLFNHIFKAEARFTPDLVYWASLLGMAEAIRTGTTTISEMYFFAGSVAKAAAQSGINAHICNGFTNFDGDFDPKTDKQVAEVDDLLKTWHNHNDGQIVIDCGIHAEYTSGHGVWEYIADFAGQRGLATHLHLSETRSEHEECIEKYGATPAEMFYKAGVLNNPVRAAHCVWVSDNDIEIMRQTGTAVVSCPVSNLKLSSGIAPVAKMLKAGVKVCLGTDSVASNNCHDMFAETKTAALVQKYKSDDPTVLDAPTALALATTAGAAALGRNTAIAPGARADLIMLDLDAPNLYPQNNPVSNIVYSASGANVCMTMVGGRILYENGEFNTIDIEQARFEFSKHFVI